MHFPVVNLHPAARCKGPARAGKGRGKGRDAQRPQPGAGGRRCSEAITLRLATWVDTGATLEGQRYAQALIVHRGSPIFGGWRSGRRRSTTPHAAPPRED